MFRKDDIMNYHIIRVGETISYLTEMYHISEDAIARANPTIDLDQLIIGQIILIPLAPYGEYEDTNYY